MSEHQPCPVPIDEHVHRLVAAAPSLTREQVERLAVLLRHGAERGAA